MAAKNNGYREDPREAVFNALARSKRIQILELLKEGEKSISDLLPILGIDQSAISRHLSILRNAGLIRGRKQGVNVYFSISDERVLKLLELATEIVRERNKRLLESLKS
jgi:ArsR family transcriptional regulator